MERGREFTFDYRPPRGLESTEGWGTLDYHDAFGARYDDLRLGMLGSHQAANAALSLAALGVLGRSGWRITEEAVRRGLARAVCPARIEVLGRWPVVVVDTAHNRASAAALVEVLRESFSVRRRWLVFGTTLEKDLGGMLDVLLGAFDEVIFTRYSGNPRSVDPAELARLAAERTGRQYPVVCPAAAAWAEAMGRAGAEDLVCASGSFFLAAEIRRLVLAAPATVQEVP